MATTRYNDIKVQILPNPQYLQTAASDLDTEVNRDTSELNGSQILSLKITKSYEYNTTEVVLTTVDMDNATISSFDEGKLILFISASPFEKVEGSSAEGYFMGAKNSIIKQVGMSPDGYPRLQVTMHLKSVLLTRLEIETHLTFLLGGKGNFGAVSTADSPLTFYKNEFSEYFNEAYAPSSNTRMFNNITSAENISSAVVTTSPSLGYKIEVDTNLQIFNFLFDHYPLFKTPYGWLIDDFSTDPNGGVVCIKDYLRYDAWKSSIDPYVSQVVGEAQEQVSSHQLELERLSGINSNARRVNEDLKWTSMYSFIDFRILRRVSLYNTGRYLFRDAYPLIYAESISDNQVIPTDTWNRAAENAFVLTAVKGELRVKNMFNPMIKSYLTFLSSKEITEVQKYQALFMNLHPELIRYHFSNLLVGEVDIHQSVTLNKERLGQEEHYGFDRIGTGYHVEHLYTQAPIDPAINDANQKVSQEAAALFTPRFELSTTIDFLVVDQGPITIEELDNLDRVYSSKDKTFTDLDLTQFNDINACVGESGVDLGNIPAAEPGSPGNTSIRDSAQTLISHGFRYVWGGVRADGMDCSAFTQRAILNSGASQGRKSLYPRTTTTQFNWLTNPANGAQRITDLSQIQAGDIVFFKTSRGSHGHTGIARDNTSYFHSNSVKKKGADIGYFPGGEGKRIRRPSYIFRLMPMQNKVN